MLGKIEDNEDGRKSFVPVEKKPKINRMVWKPNPGMVWNKLREFPRNEPCFCGSKKKFKKCHLPFLTSCTDEESAKKIDEFFRLRKAGRNVRITLSETSDKNVSTAELATSEPNEPSSDPAPGDGKDE